MIKLMENMSKEELIAAFKNREKELCEKIESDRISKVKLIKENELLAAKEKKFTAKEKTLIAENKKLISEINERKLELQQKNEYIKILENARYSSQRNNIKEYNQGPDLFSLIGIDFGVVTETEEIEVKEIKGYKRKVRIPKEKHINYDHLKTNIIDEPTPENFDVCDLCGTTMKIKKYDERKELVYTPAKVEMNIYRTPVYECVACQEHNLDGKSSYKRVPGRQPVIKGSIASPSLIANIMDMKYLKGLPLAAQEKRFLENDVVIPRQNMANWMIKASVHLGLLFECMRKDLLAMNVIHCDETTTQILNEEGKTAQSKSYMWVVRTCQYDVPIILYRYDPTRSKRVVEDFIGDYSNYLVTDAYGAYEALDNVTNCFCHVHAFRYFRKALEVLPKGSDKSKSYEYTCYRYYQKIFEAKNKIETTAKSKHGKNPVKYFEYVHKGRNDIVKPIYDNFLAYLKEIILLPEVNMKPTLIKAINYELNHEKEFREVFNNPKVPFDNSSAERVIRPFVVSRNRCKFYTSPKGAQAAAIIYSLLLSAEENGLSAYMYMEYVLERLPSIDPSDEVEIRKLLPYNKDLPKYLRQLTAKEIKELKKGIQRQK